MSISGAAKLAGVIGWPVAHSLSPRLHGYWLDELGIDGALVPLAVRPEDFSIVIGAMILAGFKGVSVTVPHKQAAFALAHTSDEAARLAGAANLLVFGEGGRIAARNTDSLGLAESLRETLGAGVLVGKAAVILGAGGAARAAVLALGELGASQIRIVNRTPQRAEALAASLGKSTPAKLLAMSDWPRAAKDAALLINTTSTGMKGSALLNLPLDPLPVSAAVCDIVYNPLQTDLLKRAQARGHRIVDGLGMLMHQAAPAFAAFFDAAPKVTADLRRALEKALNDES